MRDFGSSLEQISNKLLSAEAAVEVVKPGDRVFVGTASATPFTLVEASAASQPRLTSSYFISLRLVWGHFGSSSNLLITTAVSSSARKRARSFRVGRPNMSRSEVVKPGDRV